jgi:hypothetical protein
LPALKKLFLGILFILFIGCSQNNLKNGEGKVHVEKRNGRYIIYKNNKPFFIKGAAGYSHLDVLNAAGGNTIRIWDTTHIADILQQANKNHIAVIIGLSIPESVYTEYYDDTVKVNRQFQSYKKLVNKYKNDPAILMWCVGNELDFPFKLPFNNFYSAFNHIVEMIHHDDPDHPVTTTMVNFQPGDTFNIKTRTDIDIISFNIFGELTGFKNAFKYYKWLWNGPYLLTEWGVNGPWEDKKTTWEAAIEPTSTWKAKVILQRYKTIVPLNDPRFIGSFIFYWGQKQEITPTWFSLFDEDGKKTEVINAMQYIWLGTWPVHQPPQILDLLVNRKKGDNNIFLSPGANINAEIVLTMPDSAISTIKWKLYKEDWYRRTNINNTTKLTPLSETTVDGKTLKSAFTAPRKEGPYRLFAYVYDKYGYVATCNVPFYVLEDTK